MKYCIILIICLCIFAAGCIGGTGTPVISLVQLTPEQLINDARTLLSDKDFLTDITEIRNSLRKLEQTEEKASSSMRQKVYFTKAVLQDLEAYLLEHRRTEKESIIKKTFYESYYNFRRAEKAFEGIYYYHFFKAVNLTHMLRHCPERDRDAFYKMAQAEFETFFLTRALPEPKKDTPEEREFIFGKIPVSEELGKIMLCRLFNEYGDFYQAGMLAKELDALFDFRHPLLSLWKFEKARMFALMERFPEAAACIEDFKSDRYSSFLFYPEGLWMLEGLYYILSKYDRTHEVNIAVTRSLLTEYGGFYADNTIMKFEEFIPKHDFDQTALIQAQWYIYNDETAKAKAILEDITDISRTGRMAAQKISTPVITQALYLYGQLLENDKESSLDRIKSVYIRACNEDPENMYAAFCLKRLKILDGESFETAAMDAPKIMWIVRSDKKKIFSKKLFPLLSVKVAGSNIVSVTLNLKDHEFTREAKYDEDENVYIFDEIFPKEILKGEFEIEVLNSLGKIAKEYILVNREKK